jgi:hypothetical protein
MAVCVGLEVTGKRVNVVVVEGSAKAVKFRFAFSEEIGTPPEGTEEKEFRSARLTEILKKHRVPRGNIICSLPVQDVFAREVMVPFVREDQIRKTIRFEAEEYLPGTRADNMVVDFYKIGQIEQKSRVLVFAAKKEKIRDFLAFLSSSAIEPAGTGLDAAYLFLTALACRILPSTDQSPAPAQGEKEAVSSGEESQEKTGLPLPATFVAALSEDRVCLVLAEGDRLRRVRGFRLGQNENTLEKLVREISRTIAAAPGLSSIQKVYISGPRANPLLASELTSKLGTDASLLDVSCVFKDALTDEQKGELAAAGSIALGSALAGLGIDQARINFRRDEFAYQKAFEKLKTGLACTVCLLFVICFVLCYCFQFKRSQNKHLLELHRSFAQDIFKAVVPEKKMRGENVSSIYQSYEEALNARKLRRIKTEKAQVVISALNILNEIATFVFTTRVNFQLTGCDIKQTGIVVQGIVPTIQEGQVIVAAIDGESEYLAKRSDSMKPMKDGKYEFTYTFALKQPKDNKEK